MNKSGINMGKIPVKNIASNKKPQPPKITVAVTAEEKARIKAMAEASGYNVSELIKQSLFHRESKTIILPQGDNIRIKLAKISDTLADFSNALKAKKGLGTNEIQILMTTWLEKADDIVELLSNDDIRALFGKLSKATVNRLKQKAKIVSKENERLVWDCHRVNTEDAYTAWGLDINDLEFRLKKLREFEKLKSA